MRAYRPSWVLLLAVAAGSSCIRHVPTRTVDPLNPPADLPAPCAAAGGSVSTSITRLTASGPAGDQHRREVACVSHERHLSVSSGLTSLPHAGFDLHVLEFDDGGQPWNLDQQDRTFEALRRQLDDPSGAVVVVFVHGWKNDAAVCNGKLACFRDVLEILAKAETAFSSRSKTGAPPRRVVGVYIGWRGGTIRTRLLKQLTFWGRKHTAHTIGDNGGVSAVIERLRTMVAESRGALIRGRSRSPFETTSLVFVGHSFGAALLYSAVATSLNASVGSAVEQALGSDGKALSIAGASRRQTGRQPIVVDERPVRVRSGGDLIVLVNPAMEASRFANLNQVRNLRFRPDQVPIFLTLASEGDDAVGGFFPLGQSLATLSRSARSRETWLSMVKGFGLYAPYHTHRIVAKPANDVPLSEKVSGTCRCGSNLGAFGDALIMRLTAFYDALQQYTPSPDTLRMAAYQEMLYARFEPVRDVDPNNPFIMASVDTAVIADHNDIFNPRFIDFLIEYVIRSEVKRWLTDDYERAAR